MYNYTNLATFLVKNIDISKDHLIEKCQSNSSVLMYYYDEEIVCSDNKGLFENWLKMLSKNSGNEMGLENELLHKMVEELSNGLEWKINILNAQEKSMYGTNYFTAFLFPFIQLDGESISFGITVLRSIGNNIYTLISHIECLEKETLLHNIVDKMIGQVQDKQFFVIDNSGQKIGYKSFEDLMQYYRMVFSSIINYKVEVFYISNYHCLTAIDMNLNEKEIYYYLNQPITLERMNHIKSDEPISSDQLIYGVYDDIITYIGQHRTLISLSDFYKQYVLSNDFTLEEARICIFNLEMQIILPAERARGGICMLQNISRLLECNSRVEISDIENMLHIARVSLNKYLLSEVFHFISVTDLIESYRKVMGFYDLNSKITEVITSYGEIAQSYQSSRNNKSIALFTSIMGFFTILLSINLIKDLVNFISIYIPSIRSSNINNLVMLLWLAFTMVVIVMIYLLIGNRKVYLNVEKSIHKNKLTDLNTKQIMYWKNK